MKEKAQVFFGKLNPIFAKLGQNYYLQAISASMMSTLGVLMVGSIAVLLMVFPIQVVKDAVGAMGLMPILASVNSITIGALAVYVVFLMAKNITIKFLPEDDGIGAGLIALMSFFIVTPLGMTADNVTAIPGTWLGAQGVFSAMIIGLFVGRIYVLFRQKNWMIKMPDSVPPMVTNVFNSLVPSLAIGVFFIVVARIFSGTSFGSMHQFIYSLIQSPLKSIGGTIGALIFMSILQQVLWFFGIHGTNVVMPIVQALWISMDVENLSAIAAGQAPPNIVGYAFFMVITWGGLALGLVLLMLRSKSAQYRELGKVAIVPALFGITEPVIFGTPLVLNFDLAIPFIFNNSIALLLTYLLTKIGIISVFTGITPVFGLPIGFHAAIQGSVTIILAQLAIQLVLSPILWYPWFKRVEKRALEAEQESLNS